MSARYRLALLLVFLLLGVGSVLGAEVAHPNFLWISLEDISPDLGCYGDTYAVTPHIDKLAASGARFTRAFTHAGVCAPSRSGIITGMYPTTIGTHHMRSKGVPPAHVRCFTEYLRAAGYYCTNDSKTDYNFDVPITAWDESRAGAHWRNRPTPETPFFAVINLVTTHESQIRLPEAQLAKRRQTLAPHELHDPAKAQLPPYYPDTPVVRRDWANYYDNLTFTDKRVGEILQQLADDGLDQNTVVFFWGDHGRGLPRAKRWQYDSGTHIPLIVRWPGKIPPQSVRDDLVCVLDFAPTLLSLAGVPIPKHLQGQVILGPQQGSPREYVFGARDRMDETYDIIRAVRDRRFKYLRNYEPQKTYAQPIAYMDEMPTMQEWRRLHAAGQLTGPQTLFFQLTKPVEELYDTDADPYEVNNLASQPEHQTTLARLRAAHEQWMRDSGDLGLTPESELNERDRPGGKWSTTNAPQVSIVDGHVQIVCETEGASLAYLITKSSQPRPKPKDQRWQLYSKPFVAASGSTVLAKACRLGFKDSEDVQTNVP